MILRRFMEHVREQNWFAVGLDVLVVIVGIFLGMQVTEWNESRKDQNSEKAYLLDLHRDMIASVFDQGRELEILKENLPNYATVVKVVLAGELSEEDRDSFLQGLNSIGESARPVIHFSTVLELQQSGKFHLISNPEIRRKILDLQEFEVVARDVMRNTQNLTAQVVPDLLRGVLYHDEAQKAELTWHFEDMRHDRRKAEAYAFHGRNLASLHSHLRGLREETEDLLEALEAEMKRQDIGIPVYPEFENEAD